MRTRHTQLPLAFALALGVGAITACPAAAPPDDNGGEGGEEGTATGGKGADATGGKKTGTGGSGTGGSSTGGATGTGGGGGESTGGGGGSSTGGGGGSSEGPDAGGADMPPAGGKMMITVDSDPKTSTPTRLCFKPEAGADGPNGGDVSPKIDWTAPPPGTMSLVVMMEDLSNTPTPHQVVCNLKPTETGRPADAKATIPEGAQKGTGHSKPMDTWYGPGAGVRNYEITVFALATPMLEGGCGPGGTKAKAARDYLKKNKMNKAIILDYDSKVLWGSAGGACK